MTTEEMIEYANQLTCKGSAIIDAINVRDADATRASAYPELREQLAAVNDKAIEDAINREVTPETAAAALSARQADQ